MPFAQYEEDGRITGFWVADEPPKGSRVIEISEKQWLAALQDPRSLMVKGGKLVAADEPTEEQKEMERVAIAKQRIAARRYDEETKGIVISGTTVATDRDSQALITGATVQAMIDPSYTLKFKTAAGFITLDAKKLVGMAIAVRSHVQACFDREAELLTALEDGTYEDVMLNQGWPA